MQTRKKKKPTSVTILFHPSLFSHSSFKRHTTKCRPLGADCAATPGCESACQCPSALPCPFPSSALGSSPFISLSLLYSYHLSLIFRLCVSLISSSFLFIFEYKKWDDVNKIHPQRDGEMKDTWGERTETISSLNGVCNQHSAISLTQFGFPCVVLGSS